MEPKYNVPLLYLVGSGHRAFVAAVVTFVKNITF